ncbi:hypothetical protein ILUMI_16797 [Ignelater luminosus]|uniref:Endonuclease-reverse transcriptase n=1 Tax=Ignelater luminosus TaxID=2038154 RepID=A0A8K0CTM9_IGNLU|nr:hypothetical protein ILUMI_16797 [Ignelater luminosus]
MKSLERETRRRNLVIKGVANAERKREGETKDIILKIVDKTGVTIESNMQVDEARRLKRYEQDETRPILLKLTTRQKKMEILEHVKELKDILALQETKQLGNEIVNIGEYTLFKSSGKNSICYLRLRGKYRKISIINGHAPTEEKEAEIKTEKIPKYDMKLVVGDLNAKVGREEEQLCITGGRRLRSESNENG